MTFTGIRPVGDEDASVGPLDEVESAEPGISDAEEVGLMTADEPESGALDAL